MQFVTVKENITLKFAEITLQGDLVFDKTQAALALDTPGAPLEVLSTNLKAYGLAAVGSTTWIKDWSEHTGLAEALENIGAVSILGETTVGPFAQRAYHVKVEGLKPLPKPIILRDLPREESVAA